MSILRDLINEARKASATSSLQKLKKGSEKGEIRGEGFVLQYSPALFRLMEIPKEGAKQYRVSQMPNPYMQARLLKKPWLDSLHPALLLKEANVWEKDSFDHVKTKIKTALLTLSKDIVASGDAKFFQVQWSNETFDWHGRGTMKAPFRGE